MMAQCSAIREPMRSRKVRVVAGQTVTMDFNIPLPQGGARE